MGIPGMNRVIDMFFTANVKTDYDFLTRSTLIIDGNVALYEVMNNTPLTPESVLAFCEELVITVSADTKIITFDGLPPLQKIIQQIKRRKLKYETYDALTRQNALDLSSSWYQELIDDTQLLLRANGWKLLSQEIVGEGEQKIVDYIREITNSKEDCERLNIVVWTKDWDVFVLLLNIPSRNDIALYLWMCLINTPFLLSINKCLMELEDKNITPLHYMACCLLFGSDFYLGVGNMKLDFQNFQAVIYTSQFVFSTSDGINIDCDLLLETLDALHAKVHQLRDLPEELGNYDSTESSSSSSKTTQQDNISLSMYSNVRSLKLNIDYGDCGGSCSQCQPSEYCSKKEISNSCYQYFNMYHWTLLYFTGKLRQKSVERSTNIYTHYIAPPLAAVRCWLGKYNIPNGEYSIDIISAESYINVMKEAFNLQFYELIPCKFITSYDRVLCCKEYDKLSCVIPRC